MGQWINGKWVSSTPGLNQGIPEFMRRAPISDSSTAIQNTALQNNIGKINADGSYTGAERNTGLRFDRDANSMNQTSGLQTGLQGIQALSGLANAYVGYKGLGLAKDQFSFKKAAANRDVANQAKLLNESRMNSGNVGLALAGNTMTDAQKIATRNRITAGNVDGSRIG